MQLDIEIETYNRLFQLAADKGLPVSEYLDQLISRKSTFYSDLRKFNAQRSFDKAEDVVPFLRSERDRWN